MLFPTVTFGVFLFFAVVAHYATQHNRRLWLTAMIAASAVFIAWADLRLVVFVGLFAGWTKAGAHLLSRAGRTRRDRWYLVGLIGGALLALAATRYLLFLIDATAPALQLFGADLAWRPSSWWVPLGVSFITFQSIMVFVDSWRKELQTIPTWAEALLLVGFFPKYAAGPLVKPQTFIDELRRPGPRPTPRFSVVAALISAGLLKKVLVADTLNEYVRTVIDDPGTTSRVDAFGVLFAAPVRIYCDLSAYADFAVASALLLGVVLPFNFNRPFAATSVADFWRRWHMTISGFFRNYVFLPLRTANPSPAFLPVAAVLTLSLSGLWHGAGWGFVLWGSLHGAAIYFEGRREMTALARRRELRRAGQRAVRPSRSGWHKPVGAIRAFTFVAVTSPLFSTRPLAESVSLLTNVLNPMSAAHLNLWIATLMAIPVLCHWIPQRISGAGLALLDRVGIVPLALVVASAATLAFSLGPPGIPPFIYFRF